MNLIVASFSRSTGDQKHPSPSETTLWPNISGCSHLLFGIAIPSKLGAFKVEVEGKRISTNYIE